MCSVLLVTGVVGAQEAHDHVHALLQQRAGLGGVEADHLASVGSAPGPTPSMTLPRVRWSSSTMRSATHSGLWYET